jgi:OMF family outer membrane factor
MKNGCLAILAMFAMAMPVFSQRVMSKNEMIRHAFENSEILAQLNIERKRVTFMREEYYGRALPDISGGLNYMLSPNLNEEVSISDPMMAPMAPILDELTKMMNPKNAMMWELTATQVIYAQGKVRTGLRIADIALETIEEQYREAQINLAQKISGAYNQTLLAQQNLTIHKEGLAIADESYRIAKARFEMGQGSALDTLNTRFGQQQAILRLREAQKNKTLAMKALANAASLDGEDFILNDSLVVQQFDLTEEAAWEVMQENNTSLRLMAQGKTLQAEQTHLLRTDYLPMIGATASIGRRSLFDNGDEFMDNWSWDFKIGVGVQVPIWNGGQRRNRLRQAELEELKLVRQEIDLKNVLRLALSVAFEELEVSREELAQAEQMIVLAEQMFKISKLAYELGQITQLELDNSEQNNRTAKLMFNGAIYKINSAVLNIEKLIGSENLILAGN